MMNVKFSTLFALLLTAATGCAGAQPQAPRLQGAVLRSCPDSPKCVSSQSEDPNRKIAPLEYSGTPEAAFAKLRQILATRSDSRIAVSTPTYLKVEFKTFLGFIDDGEFYLDAGKKVIECRSEARSGYWDLGKNRRRMEEIREQFSQENSESGNNGKAFPQKENPCISTKSPRG